MDTAIAVFIVILAVAVLARRAYRTFRSPADCGCAGCGCGKKGPEACGPDTLFEDCQDENCSCKDKRTA